MIRTVAVGTSWLALAAALMATPAAAQVPNEKTRIEQLARDNPNTFACAHTPAACGWNFVKLVACKLNPEPSNGRWGANGKRGDPNVLSWDALNWKGEGPGNDPTDGNRPVTVIDFIVGAGGPSPRVDWNIINESGPGAWVKPRCKGDVPDPKWLAGDSTDNPIPVPPAAPVYPPYPGDEVFDAIANMLFADYAAAGQAPNAGMGRWFGRTVYDWLAGNTKTLDESIQKHRLEWLVLLPKPQSQQ